MGLSPVAPKGESSAVDVGGAAQVAVRGPLSGWRSVAGRRGGASAWVDRHIGVLLVLPAVVLILLLSAYPLVFSLWVDFVNYDFQIPGHDFVGWQNFREVIADPVAWTALINTAELSAVVVGLELLLGLLLALSMLKPFRGRGMIMPVLIMPLFMSPAIVGQFWGLLLQRPFGPADYVLGKVLGHPVTISWLTEAPWNFVAIVLADAWQWTPFMFVILLAGLASISGEFYEAADLDGATAWHSFFHVTLPLLAPIILLAVTFRLLDAVKLFDIIYIMTGGGPGTSTYTASFYLYENGFQEFHLSQATAGSWILLLLSTLLITVLVRRLLRPTGP
jgi:multiple sugar transport system permease protein